MVFGLSTTDMEGEWGGGFTGVNGVDVSMERGVSADGEVE